MTETILRTIEFNVAQVKSIFTTMESGFFFFDQANFVDNQVNPEDAGNTFLTNYLDK